MTLRSWVKHLDSLLGCSLALFNSDLVERHEDWKTYSHFISLIFRLNLMIHVPKFLLTNNKDAQILMF